MARMLVIYRTPSDPAAFERHYFTVHVPLAKQLPGLRSYRTSRGPVTQLTPGAAPHLVAELEFDSLDAIRAAFATDAGRACAADRRVLAPGEEDCTMLLFEDAPA